MCLGNSRTIWLGISNQLHQITSMYTQDGFNATGAINGGMATYKLPLQSLSRSFTEFFAHRESNNLGVLANHMFGLYRLTAWPSGAENTHANCQ